MDSVDRRDATATDCQVAEPAQAEHIKSAAGTLIVSTKNRFLSISTFPCEVCIPTGYDSSFNEGRNHAIKVTITRWPGFFPLLDPEMWVGPTSFLSQRARLGLTDAVPPSDTKFHRVGTLQCQPFFQDCTNLHSCRSGGGINATECDPSDANACGGNPLLCQHDAVIHVHHPIICSDAEYRIEALDESCDPCDPNSYAPNPLVLNTSRMGDVAGAYLASDDLWSGPDGNVGIFPDTLAVLDAFLDRPRAPTKPRAEILGFGTPGIDGHILIGDVLFVIDVVRGVSWILHPLCPFSASSCEPLCE